jgi:hypothetical protein
VAFEELSFISVSSLYEVWELSSPAGAVDTFPKLLVKNIHFVTIWWQVERISSENSPISISIGKGAITACEIIQFMS